MFCNQRQTNEHAGNTFCEIYSVRLKVHDTCFPSTISNELRNGGEETLRKISTWAQDRRIEFLVNELLAVGGFGFLGAPPGGFKVAI